MGLPLSTSNRRDSTTIAMPESISVQEISKHNIPEDLWVVVDDNVYDLTEFAPEHPGGAAIIHRYAGRDASTAYDEVHVPSLIKSSLDSSKHVGTLDSSSITDTWAKPPPSATTSFSPDSKPPLDTLISTQDTHAEDMGLLLIGGYRPKHESKEQLRIRRHRAPATDTSQREGRGYKYPYARSRRERTYILFSRCNGKDGSSLR